MLSISYVCRSLLATSLAATTVSAYSTITHCKPGYVALTYDDGPNTYTSALIDYLNENEVKATFFVNGDNFFNLETEEGAGVIRHAYESGHQIASHTWSHKDLTTLSDEEYDEEVFNLENAINSIIHEKPAFLRPPYGSINDEVNRKLHQDGYQVVIWSTDTKDFESHDIDSEMENIEESVASDDEGYIVLAHDVYQETAVDLTVEMIKYFKKKNFQFATVAECVDSPAYK